VLKRQTYPKVLIIDEIRYLPLNRHEASLFFRLLVRRYEKASLIVTTHMTRLHSALATVVAEPVVK
jgi:DNA replication protein DnaC